MVLEGREIRDAFLAYTLGRQLSEGLLTGGTQSEKIFLIVDLVDREGLLRDEQDVEVLPWPFVLVAPVVPSGCISSTWLTVCRTGPDSTFRLVVDIVWCKGTQPILPDGWVIRIPELFRNGMDDTHLRRRLLPEAPSEPA